MPHQEVLCQEMRDKVEDCGTQSFRDGCDGRKVRTVVVHGVSWSQHPGTRVKTVRNFVCYFSSVNSDWLLVTAVFFSTSSETGVQRISFLESFFQVSAA